MAPRIRKIRHDEETRAKIQASQLVNRLQKHALGEVDLSTAQVRSCEILLDRVLPRLSAVELSGNVTLSHEEALDQLSDDATGT